ncbi:MAG: hypothetical protein ACRDRN_25270 [Sciscionella sp.]
MNVYQITFPNRKIYVGRASENNPLYFGSSGDVRSIAADLATDLGEEWWKDLTLRKQILWLSDTAWDAVAEAIEKYWIWKTGANTAETGYNKNPRFGELVTVCMAPYGGASTRVGNRGSHAVAYRVTSARPGSARALGQVAAFHRCEAEARAHADVINATGTNGKDIDARNAVVRPTVVVPGAEVAQVIEQHWAAWLAAESAFGGADGL